jgi:hypothetical protein
MAIKIVEEPDVYVTSEEFSRYCHQYRNFMRGYCGPRISLEDFIRQTKRSEEKYAELRG